MILIIKVNKEHNGTKYGYCHMINIDYADGSRVYGYSPNLGCLFHCSWDEVEPMGYVNDKGQRFDMNLNKIKGKTEW